MKLSKILIASSVGCVMALSSCKTPHDVTYFQNPETVVELVSGQHQIILKPGDKITIVVKSKDPVVSDLFNLPNYTQRLGSGSSSGNNPGITNQTYRMVNAEGVSSYTVTPEGMIDFPILGNIKVAGMSRSELAGFIKGELMGRDLVKDPTVTVEFLNSGVNVLGSVQRPGRYEINTDSYSLFDAIAMAGDLQLNGKRQNVKVLREENGSIKVYTIDMTDLKQAAQSPAFFLQQNDVIYVEPNDLVKRSTTLNGNNALSISFWISVASLITTAVTTVGVFVRK